VSITGAQPEEKFIAAIDAELTKAKARLAEGTRPELVYTTMANENFRQPSPSAATASAASDTTTVWNVPVAGAPSRGSDAALVTIVEFADFQCPFCRRVEPTVEKIRSTYGDKVRIVWRDEPLPFHTRAVPAAEVAREVRTEKGNLAFWNAHDALLASPKLEDADLDAIAKAAGADVGKVRDAVTSDRYRADIGKDASRAKDVEATGIPTFFINGRKLVGAQPFEKFQSMIDEEIAHAQAVLARGTARASLYEAMVRAGRTASGGGNAGALGVKTSGPTAVLPDGLAFTELVVGKGPAVKSGDRVTVHYVGTLDDGTVFDSSRKRGTPFTIAIGTGRVIKGWDEGVPGMRVGGKRKLVVPAALAYGQRSVGQIPAGSNLTFEIEVLSVE
jgi:FKBP-type peptidyl-prolyl cis-trans isomerase/protein-disulfide isomerase